MGEPDAVDCICKGDKLSIGQYAVDHFIPHHFVSHDLIWNLIPAQKIFNLTKGNKLPPAEKYFESFFSLQKAPVEIVLNKSPNNQFPEDYLTIFPDLNSLTYHKFKERTQQPMINIAHNNGFEFLL